VLGSVALVAINVANEAEVNVTMFVTGGTFVYVSYMLLITEPLNPPML
jgi:hypothetical protein